MKYLFLILFSFNAYAGFVSINHMTEYEAEEGSTNYKRKADCEEREGAECLDMTGVDPKNFVVASKMDEYGIYTGKHFVKKKK